MSDMKPKGVNIKLGNKEYGLRFTLNAIDDIQDHFDVPISKLVEILKDEKAQIKNLKYLLTTLINEDLDCQADETGEKAQHLDERYVGRHIDPSNMRQLMESILSAFTVGMPEPDEDEVPNAQSGQ